ncbi:MAG: hypothetical protein Q8O30_01550 [Candidatus Omnitrophota bacterium]|nr:hypothetical protein [Candidatus Omnitrophota bacterium]
MSKNQLITFLLIAMFVLTGCHNSRTSGRKFTKISKCPVHKVEMKEVTVIYGYPDEELLKKAEKGEVILGGCIIRKEKIGYICPVDKKIFYRR